MNTEKDKYGFSFEWFLNTYEKLNSPVKAYMLDIYTKSKINDLYDVYYLNYKNFIDHLAILIGLTEQDKIQYLKQEAKCSLCNLNYPYCSETHIYYFDSDSKKEITNKMCWNCIYSKKTKCDNCDFDLFAEPYEHVYICKSNSELLPNYFCSKCKD